MDSEVKVDILFSGLLLIPVLILAVPYLKTKLALLNSKLFQLSHCSYQPI
jgi:hypothetical protein